MVQREGTRGKEQKFVERQSLKGSSGMISLDELYAEKCLEWMRNSTVTSAGVEERDGNKANLAGVSQISVITT